MKRRLLWSVGIALFLATTSVLAQDQAPAPSFKDGDSWQFNMNVEGARVSSSARFIGIYEMVYSQGQVKVYEVNGNQKTEMDITSEGPGSSYIGINEQRPSLKFPLSVGQKWNYEYVDRPVGARQDQKRSVEVTVTGIEQVTTPAGSFRAYKLVRIEQYPGAGKQSKWNRSTTTYFYTPDTRSVVKSTTVRDLGGTSSSELIKFTPGK